MSFDEHTENNLTFDGHDMSKLILIQKWNKGVQLGRVSKYQTREDVKGADFLGTTSEVVIITSEFLFHPDSDPAARKQELADILNVSEPKRLENSSEPDIYYMAFPVSKIASAEDNDWGAGVITWEIPEGVAYSRGDLEFTNLGKSDILQVDNPGSEPALLDMKATFHSDSGFIGLSDKDDTINVLFGDMTEIDKEPYEASVRIFDDHMYKDPGTWTLNNGITPPVTPTRAQEGAVAFVDDPQVSDPTEGFVKPTSWGSDSTSWHGPSLTKTIPVEDQVIYFGSDFRLDFNPDGAGAGNARASCVGHGSITYADQNGNIIVAIVFEDNNSGAEKSDLAIYIDNKRVYDSRETNDYYVTARPNQANHVTVDRWEDKIDIRLRGSNNKTHQLSFPVKIDKTRVLHTITWYSAKYKAYRNMQNNLLRAINVDKYKVTKYKDLPNKFKDKDVLIYRKENRDIIAELNGLSALAIRDIGSNIIEVPANSSTTFFIAYSDFAEIPTVELTGKARYTI